MTSPGAEASPVGAWSKSQRALLWLGRVGPAPGASWPGERVTTWGLTAFIVLWALLSAFVLLQTGHFTYDQAYFWDQAVQVAERLRWPAYGPFVSGVHPSPLTPGGMLFVVLAPPFLVATDPRFGLAWIHLLAALGAWLFDWTLRRLGVAPSYRIATLVLYLASTAHARAEETFWNGDLFLFITPALLALATYAAQDERRRWWPYALLGATGALSLQTHLSGGMGLGIALLILLLHTPSAPALRHLLAFVAGLLACYLPYVLFELAHGAPNTALLKNAVPASGVYSPEALERSLLLPVMYAAHAERPEILWGVDGSDWTTWAARLSGWSAAVLALLGLVVRHPLKPFSLLVLLGVPAYYRLTGRPYQDHYVASVVPLAVLFAGAGLGWLATKGAAARALCVAYLTAYVAAGAALLLTQLQRPVLSPSNPWNGMTVAVQLERTRQALALGRPVPSGPGDELAYVQAVLARRVLKQELLFDLGGHVCRVDEALSAFEVKPPRPLSAPLANNSVFVCER